MREQAKDEETRREEQRLLEERERAKSAQTIQSGLPTAGDLRSRAQVALEKLGGLDAAEHLTTAKQLVAELRNVRDLETMGLLVEAVRRQDPRDAKNGRLYAQYFIDTGKASAAVHLLKSLARTLPKDHPEFGEVAGLLGRSYKQIFFDAGDKSSPGARYALKEAIDAYRKPFESNPQLTWHGINLLSLLVRARKLGLRVARDLDPREIAQQLVTALEATPPQLRDEWFLPTLAEAYLGLEDWDAVERCVRWYATSADVSTFQIASTIRQFTQVWGLDESGADERGRALIDILRARLIQLPGGEIEIGRRDVQRAREQVRPGVKQLEAVLGTEGIKTFDWLKTGLDRARAVGAVQQRDGMRIGSCFLVRAGDLGLAPAEESMVLTCWYIVNNEGAGYGLRPEQAEIVFEAANANRAYAVGKIIWSSSLDRHDVSVLRLETPVTDIPPLPIAEALPVLEDKPRVYLLAHPGGRGLSISLQDNELLDHEGPPHGRPQIPGVCRVHYRAPTAGGSGGGPVFNSSLWEVIAIHHKGGSSGMPRLNGVAGSYGANEGIWIQSIVAAIKEQTLTLP